MTKVLLVGSGITSAVTASILRRELPHLHLHIWDKARGPGGRMSTSRHKETPEYSVDLGAQYITATPDYAKLHNMYYKELSSEEILAPLTAKIEGMKHVDEEVKNFMIPKGSSSLVKYFLGKASPSLKFEHHVNEISQQGNMWKVSTTKGITESFDVVVLTMPVPQILGLTGSLTEVLKTDADLLQSLQSVEYSSRYALGLFYKKGQQIYLPSDNTAKYVTNDPVVRFVCIDNLKRGQDNDPPSIVVHTSVPYGKAFVDNSPEEMKSQLVKKVSEMFPTWPQPDYIKCQKWRYSQVSSAFPGLPGAISPANGLILGGDGFTHSNMDGCIESAEAVYRQILDYLKG